MTETENTENLKRCPRFESCSKNLCPLDWDIESRSGKPSDECRWLKEESKGKIEGKDIIFGGKQMPDNILKFIPEKNVKRLNQISKERWGRLGLQQG